MGTAIAREERKRRLRKSPRLALLVGAHTDIWLEREDLGTSLLLRPGKMLARKLKRSLLVMAYTALLSNIFEVLNLLLFIFLYVYSRNSATWQ